MPRLPIASTLRSTSWRDLAGWAFAAFSLLGIAAILAPSSLRPALRNLGLAAPFLLLAAKDLAHAPQAWQRFRTARAGHARVTAFLPPELLGFLRLDRQLWLGCLQRLRGRPSPSAVADGVELRYLERGAYGTARAVVVVTLVIGLPIDTLLINLFVKDAGVQALIHAVRVGAAIWSLAWLLGDRWHLGAGAHVMTDDALHLAVGMRSQGVLPLAAIARCEKVDLAPRAWCRRHGIAQQDTLSVTPFDQPNCVLVLEEGAMVDILHYGVRRRLPRHVFLYLDRPHLLAAQLALRAQA